MMWWYGGYGGMPLLGTLVMVLFWVAVLALVVWAVRSFVPREGAGTRDTALDVLNRRYAAGEISQAEYEQARRVLGYHSTDSHVVP